MEANELLAPGRLLTGYVPGAEATAAVTALARRLRARDPELIYLLDRECGVCAAMRRRADWGVAAVLGDSGKLYVSPDVVPIYRAALPLATIITPNWFEVEWVLCTCMPF